MKGLTLRQIFKKTSVGESDDIKQLQFKKIMTSICEEANAYVQETSIDKFMLEVSSRENNSVSFTELARLYNSHFNIMEDDDKQFMPFYIEKLTQHIVKIAIQKKTLNFTLENHF
jgi:hypothetical protein